MPHRKKKPFIEKKKAVSFHLVHRSQRDPLAADETAPQRVLLPTQKVNEEERRAEQRKYGVFFDDDYDYLQHLKEPAGPAELIPTDGFAAHSRRNEEEDASVIPSTGIKLPSSVFASEFEEDVGLLNKAAPVSGPRLDFDPDIVAALDDDFDFDDPDNLLEDDFVLQANKPPGEEEGVDRQTFGSEDGSEWEDVDDAQEGGGNAECDSEGLLSDEDDVSAPGGPGGAAERHLFWEEEAKSRFTEYSMTSSVMRRNEQLTLHDERFEKFYEQYDDDEIGALDNSELEGCIQVDSSRLQEVLNDYYKEKAENCVQLSTLEPLEDLPANELDESDAEETTAVVIKETREKWDCESICSTYSNLYNHPQLIQHPPKPKQIRISSKTGIPLHVLSEKGPTAKQVERMQMISSGDLPKVSTQPRSKHENKEEKRARKQAVREERKERRLEKKANKLAFKLEKRRQEKELLNLRRNVEGLKL
ncbi:protein LTV1 homolog isoform X2 [Choloepus didactylus]|uniref:protein LTV1 homolog isoform X2 n=1 Tax=Choloepus didactylus TaxID=27675 RepID=UPI00189E1F2E|nr:protein LTV1 homolog isoform X2 [Choloepus didactylus]